MKVDAKARANLRNLLNAPPEFAHDNWAMIARGLAAAADDLDAYAELEDQNRRGVAIAPPPMSPPTTAAPRFSDFASLPVRPQPAYVEPVIQAAEIIAAAIRSLAPQPKRKYTRKVKDADA